MGGFLCRGWAQLSFPSLAVGHERQLRPFELQQPRGLRLDRATAFICSCRRTPSFLRGETDARRFYLEHLARERQMLPSRPVASEGPAVAAAAPPFLPASPLSSPPLPHCHAPLHQPQWPTLTALCSFLAVSRSPTAAWAAAAGVTAAVRLLRRADTQVSEAGRGPGGEGAAACQLLLRRHVSAQNCIAVRGQLSVHFLLSFVRRCFLCARPTRLVTLRGLPHCPTATAR